MFLACRLAWVAVLAGVAAIVSSQAYATPPPSVLTKDCKVVSFKDIAKVIGPLQSKTAGRTSASRAGGTLWLCGADSRNFGVTINVYCLMNPVFGRALFAEYGSRSREGVLSWKPVHGFGDEAVYINIAQDIQTNAPSASFVVRQGNDVFIVVGHQGNRPMPVNQLAVLTRKALSNNCP